MEVWSLVTVREPVARGSLLGADNRSCRIDCGFFVIFDLQGTVKYRGMHGNILHAISKKKKRSNARYNIIINLVHSLRNIRTRNRLTISGDEYYFAAKTSELFLTTFRFFYQPICSIVPWTSRASFNNNR